MLAGVCNTRTQMVRGWGADRERSEQQDTASPACVVGEATRVPPGAHGGRGRARREPRGWGRPPAVASAHRLDEKRRPQAPLGGAASRPRTMLPGGSSTGSWCSLALAEGASSWVLRPTDEGWLWPGSCPGAQGPSALLAFLLPRKCIFKRRGHQMDQTSGRSHHEAPN